ncbi:MAG: hypothetical protein JW395_1149 [Nitrospira sp.]|nr:hypothetical protein [Nitrospira sp.]
MRPHDLPVLSIWCRMEHVHGAIECPFPISRGGASRWGVKAVYKRSAHDRLKMRPEPGERHRRWWRGTVREIRRMLDEERIFPEFEEAVFVRIIAPLLRAHERMPEEQAFVNKHRERMQISFNRGFGLCRNHFG